MNLQNGYKVIYEKAANGKRAFYASTTGVFADAELIAELAIGEYKLIYEKNGKFYGSTTGIPAGGDHCFTEFDKVFIEGNATETTAEEQTNSQPENTNEQTHEPEQQATGDEGKSEDEPKDEE